MEADERPAPMVTDAEAAEWREWGKDDTYYWGSEPIVRLLADRERTLGLLAHAKTALNSAHAEITGMAAALGSDMPPLNVLSDIAHAQCELGNALKEAHPDA